MFNWRNDCFPSDTISFYSQRRYAKFDLQEKVDGDKNPLEK